jgi:hypothetical protein
MLLTAALIMAIISCYTEVKLVHGSATIRKYYVEGKTIWNPLSLVKVGPKTVFIEGVWFNTAGSFLLSYIIGAMFSATGMTVMLGGAISTGLSQMWFSSEAFAKDHNLSVNRMRNAIGRNTEAVKNTWNDFRQPLVDFGKIVLWTLRIITLPFVFARRAAQWYNNRV